MQITNIALRTEVGVRSPFAWVDAAGTRLAVSRSGSGQPVLCLHAVAHGGRDFEALAERIGHQGFELVCVDWPGQGRSPPDATGTPASAARYAEIAIALLESLFAPGAAPVVLGNSIGGAAAIIAADRRPDLVKALVLCNPGGLTPVDGTVRGFCRTLAGVFHAGARGVAWFPAAFSLYYRLVLSQSPARAQRARIIAAGPECAAVLAQAWRSFAEPSADIRAELQRLTPPTLFAWARGDQIVSWSRSRAAIAASRAEVQMFRGGHSPFLEDPEAFSKAFVDFARRLASAGLTASAGTAGGCWRGDPPPDRRGRRR